MKFKFLSFCSFLFFSQPLFSQDIVITTEQKEIICQVIEITSEDIKYRLLDDENLLRSISKSKVFLIIYENGKREYFSRAQNEDNTIKVSSSQILNSVKNSHYIGIGAGRGYGFIGIRYQYRLITNKDKPDFHNIAFHSALGTVPLYDESLNKIMVAGGIKYYPYKGLYVNAIIGATHIEDNPGYWEDGLDVDRYNTVYGTSLLIGADLDWGDESFGYGLNIGLGITRDFNKIRRSEFLNLYALDFGLFVRF